MIRKGADGQHYCDGKECGFGLSYSPPDPVDGPAGSGLLTCLDCGASMHSGPPSPAPAEGRDP